MNLEIIYEDNHLIAVNKPAGVLTQPTQNESESLETAVKQWLKEKYKKPGNVFLGVVHRLDRPVSGLVLFAKTSKALSRLNAELRNRQIKKIYHALIEGHPHLSEGTLEHYLKHNDYQADLSSENDKESKLARLHYKTLKRYKDAALLEITLETGRYHQIRAQCAAMGCPIIGDQKYGSHRHLSEGVIALHHFSLELEHPITKEKMLLEAPCSPFFTNLNNLSPPDPH